MQSLPGYPHLICSILPCACLETCKKQYDISFLHSLSSILFSPHTPSQWRQTGEHCIPWGEAGVFKGLVGPAPAGGRLLLETRSGPYESAPRSQSILKPVSMCNADLSKHWGAQKWKGTCVNFVFKIWTTYTMYLRGSVTISKIRRGWFDYSLMLLSEEYVLFTWCC